MDPNETLATLRELVARVQSDTGRVEPEEFADEFARLDLMLSNGSSLPRPWQRASSVHNSISGNVNGIAIQSGDQGRDRGF